MEKTSDPEKKRREAAEFLFTKKKESMCRSSTYGDFFSKKICFLKWGGTPNHPK
jgi:hypothetical protein